jgi:hypothetical protein
MAYIVKIDYLASHLQTPDKDPICPCQPQIPH